MAERTADVYDAALRVQFPYNPALVNDCRQLGGRFTRTPAPAWLWPIPTPGAAALLGWLDRHAFTAAPEARASLEASAAAGLPAPEPPARIVSVSSIDIDGAYWTIHNAPGPKFRAALDLIKALPAGQRNWNPSVGAWAARVSGPSIAVVVKLRAMGWPLSTAAHDAIRRLTEADPDGLPTTGNAPPPWPDYAAPPDDLPDLDLIQSASGYRLKPFQRRGVARAVTWKRSINAFQVGLGKTITALATARYADAFPLVIVCQASKKLDWAEEAAEWIAERSVLIVDGRGEHLPGIADVYITNYDVLSDGASGQGRAAALAAIKPRMVVLDESQLIKERSAARTKAALKLVQTAEYRLLLSGTAVKSRPAELLTQLSAIGALPDFGGAAGFRKRYCNMQQRRLGGRTVQADAAGARNAIELHERLSSRWYFRLTKTEVLPELPPVRRHVIPLEIDNPAEYRKAQDEFLRWVYESSLTDTQFLDSLPDGMSEAQRATAAQSWAKEKTERASRAAQIAQVNALKRVAARGMLAGVMRWTQDYLDRGDKLILFAHHKDIQRQLYEAFPGSARLSAEDDDTTQHVHKHRFQTDPLCRLIVVSMAVGATGHTLTAADACAFVELAWTPADHDQGEGRAYGRMNDPHGLDSFWLVAHGTIYEDILELLDSKRSVVDAILDGLAPEGTDNILGDLMTRLRSAAVRAAVPAHEPPPRPAAPPAEQPSPPTQQELFSLPEPASWDPF